MTHGVNAERVAKLELLKEKGIRPYPSRFPVTHGSSAVLDSFEALEREQNRVSVAGRLIAKRTHGKASFGHLLDGAGKLQVYFREDVLGADAYELFSMVDVGDILGVTGPVFKTRTGEITVKAESMELLCKSLRPLPEKWHGLKDVETRYRQRYVDLIVNTDVRRLFKGRSRIVATIRNFLDERGFVEVETPVLQPLYGGAFARPFVTHHQALDMNLYLRIADELYLKRLVVGGLERVYEIGKDFRNEGIDRTHSPEFTQLELYQAYADYTDMMDLLEQMVCRVVTELHGGLTCTYGEHQLDFSRPWKKMSYFEALKEHLGVDVRNVTEQELRALCLKLGVEIDGHAQDATPGAPAQAFQGAPPQGPRSGTPLTTIELIDELFSEKVQPNLIQPTLVYDYPKEISPLAKEKPGSPGIAERFEPVVAGIELGNAFSEQNDPLEQARQFDVQAELRAKGNQEAQPKDSDFLRALEYGMPPTGGMGVGIDRLTMILTNARSMREVILFPHLRPEALLDEDDGGGTDLPTGGTTGQKDEQGDRREKENEV
ncbi:MAG: lysine--tRNA ligase [Candidatus Eisenbacteria bacterium]|nr:lysine--tRNA ligase [Candidatus Eisenbacteria bacterium]